EPAASTPSGIEVLHAVVRHCRRQTWPAGAPGRIATARLSGSLFRTSPQQSRKNPPTRMVTNCPEQGCSGSIWTPDTYGGSPGGGGTVSHDSATWNGSVYAKCSSAGSESTVESRKIVSRNVTARSPAGRRRSGK